MAIEDLLKKQQELMDRVPHTVRKDAHMKMLAGVGIIDALLKYLNSTGHKPWRPVPLDDKTQEANLDEIAERLKQLRTIHIANIIIPKALDNIIDADVIKNVTLEKMSPMAARKLISALGIIEESIEYVNSDWLQDPPEHRKEELTDMLFFWLEQVLMSGFTWEQIEAEYHRKWAVNIKRYEDGKKGDYSWDKRKENGF